MTGPMDGTKTSYEVQAEYSSVLTQEVVSTIHFQFEVPNISIKPFPPNIQLFVSNGTTIAWRRLGDVASMNCNNDFLDVDCNLNDEVENYLRRSDFIPYQRNRSI